MVERLLLKNMSIPYGVLHDQKLLCVKQENGRLVFTFDIEIFENNYSDEIYLKYKDFNRCDMIVNRVYLYFRKRFEKLKFHFYI